MEREALPFQYIDMVLFFIFKHFLSYLDEPLYMIYQLSDIT